MATICISIGVVTDGLFAMGTRIYNRFISQVL